MAASKTPQVGIGSKVLVSLAGAALLLIVVGAVWSWKAGKSEERRQQESYQRIEAMIDGLNP